MPNLPTPTADRSASTRAPARWRALLAGVCLVSGAQAQIYVGHDPSDTRALVLSNHASAATPELLIAAEPTAEVAKPIVPAVVVHPASTRGTASRLTPAAAEVVRRLSLEYAVAEPLIKAVIAVESGFDPRARSPKGAMGLMQLMPETARRFGALDAYSEEQNLRAGTAYLRWLLDLFAGDIELALAAYNAGEAAVVRAGRRIPNIAETRAYVPKVLAQLAHFDGQSPARSR